MTMLGVDFVPSVVVLCTRLCLKLRLCPDLLLRHASLHPGRAFWLNIKPFRRFVSDRLMVLGHL